MALTTKVFISYSHEDNKEARKIAALFDRLGIHYFLDEKDIRLAEDIHERVLQEMWTCTHILVIISPGSLQSQWVPYEIGLAKGRELPTVL